ncbi:hypothetical protein [Muricoccus nepalensis]|uniref:hypothetical protein n=1 Tax=Muricoccus nepalensis TaxID=1854500 RepID=UPI001386D0B9|nr:hypothetical protein [Roseomonas nepalensis]
MTTPTIVAIRKVAPNSREASRGTLAVFTLEDGPWLISGFEVALDEFGRPFLRPPRCSSSEARIILRSFPGRAEMLAEAMRLYGLLAVPPVAKAFPIRSTFRDPS